MFQFRCECMCMCMHRSVVAVNYRRKFDNDDASLSDLQRHKTQYRYKYQIDSIKYEDGLCCSSIGAFCFTTLDEFPNPYGSLRADRQPNEPNIPALNRILKKLVSHI